MRHFSTKAHAPFRVMPSDFRRTGLCGYLLRRTPSPRHGTYYGDYGGRFAFYHTTRHDAMICARTAPSGPVERAGEYRRESAASPRKLRREHLFSLAYIAINARSPRWGTMPSMTSSDSQILQGHFFQAFVILFSRRCKSAISLRQRREQRSFREISPLRCFHAQCYDAVSDNADDKSLLSFSRHFFSAQASFSPPSLCLSMA